MSDQRGEAEAPGPLLGRGRAADVYDLGGGRVLRRYRTEHDHAGEAAVMRHLRAHGYPVPEVFAADGRDMVMERVDGPTMLQEMGRRPWRILGYARILADLHSRLHELAPPVDLRDGLASRECVLHLDLHPDNVLLTRSGPVVIDWSNAAVGPAGADVAQTILIMAVSEADIPAPLRPFLWVLRRMFLRTFVAAAHADPAPYLAAIGRHRLSDRNVTAVEAARLTKFLERRATRS